MHVVSNDYLIQIGTAGKQSDLVVEVDNQKITKVQTFKTSFSGDLFKSVMIQLDIDVKDGTLLNGKEIKSKYGLLVNDIYEYITYNTFYTYSSEFNYDTNICKTIAYDAMVKFMVDYFSGHLNLTYPTTILNLTQAICNYIGVPLLNTNFYNADLVIEEELFTNLNCTYRDIIDYICQATCTTAIIKNNSLYFKTPEETNVTITPSLLKKLKIIKTFGPCNSLVLGRGDLNDNIFSKDDESIGEYGLQEIKFDNNEIIDKRRETVIDSMFNQIKGLTYNSFESSDLGVGIFEPADIANMQDLNGNNYRVIILNQSMTITSGAKGEMSASEPSTSTTQYKYATDSQKRQKRTEIIVNKQEGKIESVVSDVSKQNQKIAHVTQTVDELNSKIGDIADITISKENLNGTISLDSINQSEPIYVKIHPRFTNISYLYPQNNLYPSNEVYPKGRTLRFTNTITNEDFDYILPGDLLFYNDEIYDEFILNYDAQTCVVNKRVGYNADGTTYILETPETIEHEYPRIQLTDGDYTITMLGYPNAYLFVRLMAQNIYTTQFATKAEVKSKISQTTNEINLEVSKKVGNDEIISKINQTAEGITIDANRLNINGAVSANGNFKVDKNGNMECNNAKINVIGGEENEDASGLNLKVTALEGEIYKYSGLTPNTGIIRAGKDTYIHFQTELRPSGSNWALMQISGDSSNYINHNVRTGDAMVYSVWHSSNATTSVWAEGIDTPNITQTSLESIKKNFEEVENAISIVKDSEIYRYNLKSEKDTDKKHYGFVIGEKYNTPEEVIAKSGEGIDTYSMCSILWKAVQEQEEIIENLENQINQLKGENNG